MILEAVTIDINQSLLGFAALVATQLISMWRAERAAKLAASEARDAARESARLSLEAAASLAKKTDESKQELKKDVIEGQNKMAEASQARSDELKSLVIDNSALTQTSADTAKAAYHEANQVNTWRTEMDKRMAELLEVVKEMSKASIAASEATKEKEAVKPDEPQKVQLDSISSQAAQTVRDLSSVKPPNR